MNHKPSEPSPADYKESRDRSPPADEPGVSEEVPSEGGPAEQESSAHPS